MSRTLPFPVLIVGLVVSLSGCASTATIITWHPAKEDITGLARVAVIRFGGSQRTAEQVQERISAQLAESGAYELVDPTPIQRAMAPWSKTPPQDVHAALAMARRMNIDAILIGTVRTDADFGIDLGGIQIQVGDPVVKAELTYELVDVRTGTIRAKRNFRSVHDSDVPSQAMTATVLGRLTAKCIDQLVTEIAPHPEVDTIPLNTALWGAGAKLVRQGNEFAAAGDWDAAQHQWQLALRENADCHAAHYNLGVFSETRGELESARIAYQTASQLSNNVLYQRAVERVETAVRDWQVVLAQRESSRFPRPGQAPLPPPVHMAEQQPLQDDFRTQR